MIVLYIAKFDHYNERLIMLHAQTGPKKGTMFLKCFDFYPSYIGGFGFFSKMVTTTYEETLPINSFLYF